MIQQGKLPETVLAQLGFTPQKESNVSFFSSFLPTYFTKSSSGSNHSTISASSEEEKQDHTEAEDKKKAVAMNQENLIF